MRNLITLSGLAVVVGLFYGNLCWSGTKTPGDSAVHGKAPEPKSAEEKKETSPPKPQPITVVATPPALAEIDPETLKITYKKGVEPEEFAQEMVKIWANTQTQLAQCQQELQKLQAGSSAQKKK